VAVTCFDAGGWKPKSAAGGRFRLGATLVLIFVRVLLLRVGVTRQLGVVEVEMIGSFGSVGVG
jgi:hypothetical protein